jgi:5-methylcytosine-specific restriction endonuclease McrA
MANQLLSELQKWRIEVPVSYTAEELAHLSANPITLERKWPDSTYTPLKSRIRAYYKEIQNAICAYCRLPIHGGTDNIEIEHIIDKFNREDFTFEPRNLVISCHNCNFSKTTKKVCLAFRCISK